MEENTALEKRENMTVDSGDATKEQIKKCIKRIALTQQLLMATDKT